jgi:hypothetical protein
MPGSNFMPESVTNYIDRAGSTRTWEYHRTDERSHACFGVRFLPS